MRILPLGFLDMVVLVPGTLSFFSGLLTILMLMPEAASIEAINCTNSLCFSAISAKAEGTLPILR